MAGIKFTADENCPRPIIHTLHSYEFPYAYAMEGFIHFYGSYGIQEKKELTGTELDMYEKNFYLPQIVTATLNTENKYTYTLEIYHRIFDTDEYSSQRNQTIYFRVLSEHKI